MSPVIDGVYSFTISQVAWQYLILSLLLLQTREAPNNTEADTKADLEDDRQKKGKATSSQWMAQNNGTMK